MPIPDYQYLMLPVLELAAEGEIRLKTAVELLVKKLQLSEAEKMEKLQSGQTIFANRVGWAKTYLKKAGLVEITRRGHFCITQRGKEILAQKPAKIDNKFLTQFDSFNQFRDKNSETTENNETDLSVTHTNESYTPDETMRSAHQQIEETLALELLERIVNAPPDFFERLIIQLLISMGYGGSATDTGRALGQSGDNGVDGVIDQDALGLDQVYIQAKRYALGNNIGSKDIRDFFGSLDRHKASKGLFVTTSKFSVSAKETAEFLSKRIVLIDGQQLAKLMIRYNVGCRIEETLYLKKVDEEFFE